MAEADPATALRLSLPHPGGSASPAPSDAGDDGNARDSVQMEMQSLLERPCPQPDAPPESLCRRVGIALGLCTPAPRERRLVLSNPWVIANRRMFPQNVVKNTKYTWLTFFPKTLFEQFKYFFNLYFLLVAISQFVPPLKVGMTFTYVAPLAFVLSITLLKVCRALVVKAADGASDFVCGGSTSRRLVRCYWHTIISDKRVESMALSKAQPVRGL